MAMICSITELREKLDYYKRLTWKDTTAYLREEICFHGMFGGGWRGGCSAGDLCFYGVLKENVYGLRCVSSHFMADNRMLVFRVDLGHPSGVQLDVHQRNSGLLPCHGANARNQLRRHDTKNLEQLKKK